MTVTSITAAVIVHLRVAESGSSSTPGGGAVSDTQVSIGHAREAAGRLAVVFAGRRLD
jgi:hypothetical protein